MAIRFKSNLDALHTDLTAGGFKVRAVTPVSDACGRTVDVVLSNGATVCWDTESNFLWAEGPSKEIAAVEKFLHRVYEKPRLWRKTWTMQNRLALRHRRFSDAAASWLIRSDTFAARLLRGTICHLPSFRRQKDSV